MTPTLATRRKAGLPAGVVLSLVFAALLVGVATAERWMGLDRPLVPGERAPITVRLSAEPAPGQPPALAGASVIVAQGELVTPSQAAKVARLRSSKPPGARAVIGLFLAFTLIGTFLTAYLRAGQRGRHLRVQITVLGSFVALALLIKAALLGSPASAFLMPTAALAMLLGGLVDRSTGLGSAAALGLIVSALAPFDAPVAIVLGAQGVGAVLALKRPKLKKSYLMAGLAGGLAAGAAYVASYFLYLHQLPLWEITDPLRSPLVAAIIGGLLSGVLALAGRAFVERLMGEIPKSVLIELADLENPLLKRVAAEAPGTWQHSLAMANMAEIAANAIGANALLVRVGAYYHDLGKSMQPQFYIENLVPGQLSPHDSLAPEDSAARIFAHVIEGVRLGRDHGLPEPIVDFMHMHHGDGLLEYFWNKCLEQGNPKQLSHREFRYPGLKPQSKETAILAVVDAVEAASRTLRHPDAKSIEALVQRIVYGKLHLGQLDESGLTMSELKTLANTLVETLKHAHHVRIEYPWQKQEQLERAARAEPAFVSASASGSGSLPAAGDSAARPPGTPSGEVTTRFVQHVLDSADVPRPYWQIGPVTPALDTQPTRPMRAMPEPADAEAETRNLGAQSGGVRKQKTRSTVETALLSGRLPGLPTSDESHDDLQPGVVILGPPPATHPEKQASDTHYESHADTVPIELPARQRETVPLEHVPVVSPAVPAQSMPPPKRRPPPPPQRQSPAGSTSNAPAADPSIDPLRTGETPPDGKR